MPTPRLHQQKLKTTKIASSCPMVHPPTSVLGQSWGGAGGTGGETPMIVVRLRTPDMEVCTEKVKSLRLRPPKLYSGLQETQTQTAIALGHASLPSTRLHPTSIQPGSCSPKVLGYSPPAVFSAISGLAIQHAIQCGRTRELGVPIVCWDRRIQCARVTQLHLSRKYAQRRSVSHAAFQVCLESSSCILQDRQWQLAWES